MATAANVFRDYETDGVPSSGAKKPKKSEIRQLLGGYESIISAFLSNGGLIYASKASLDADLAHGANTMAWVLGDATVANNGIYRKTGGSGTGSWTRVSDLPFSFIIASDVGAGTANAIQATTSLPVSSSALVWMNVFEANTSSPVTVSFNGGAPLTIMSNGGSNIYAGGLTAGMIVLGIVSGSTFRLVSDYVSSSLLVQAEAIVAEVQGYDKAWTVFLDVVADGVNDTFLLADENGPKPVSTVDGQFFLNVHVGGAFQPSMPPADWPDIPYRIIEDGTKIQFSFVPASGLQLYAKGAAGRASDPVDTVPWQKVYNQPFVYVGNASGGDDTATLNAYLASGLPVYLKGGQTYKVGSLSVPSGSRIFLNGATLLANAGTADAVLKLASGAKDVAIEGPGKVDCDGIAPYGVFGDGVALESVKVLGCTIVEPTLDGVRFTQGRDIEISGNTIRQPAQHGVTITTSALDFKINFNTVLNPGGAGVIFSVGTRGEIIGNYVEDAGPNGDGVTGYNVSNEDVVVAHNVVKNATNAGMHIAGNRISVVGNIINGSVQSGIHLGGTDTGSPSGTEMPTYGCVLANNTVTGSALYGYNIALVNKSSITGNVSTGSQNYGMRIVQSDKNTVSGNNSEGSVAGGGYFLEGSSKNSLSGNNSSGNAADGFRLGAGGVGPLQSTYNTLTGNVSEADNRGFIEANSSDNNYLLDNRVINSVTGQNFARVGAISLFRNAPLKGSATFDAPSLADGAGTSFTITVTGAALGDYPEVSANISLSDVLMTSYVSAADTVTVRLQNESGGVRDLANAGFTAFVYKR